MCKRCTEEGAGEIGECLQILMQGPVEEKKEGRKHGVGRISVYSQIPRQFKTGQCLGEVNLHQNGPPAGSCNSLEINLSWYPCHD